MHVFCQIYWFFGIHFFCFFYPLEEKERKKMWSFIVLAYLIRGLTGYEDLKGQKHVVNPEAYMNVVSYMIYIL